MVAVHTSVLRPAIGVADLQTLADLVAFASSPQA